jgi:putative addiction module component (TIGR02574 family)
MEFQAILDEVRRLPAEDQKRLVQLIQVDLIQDDLDSLTTPQTDLTPAMAGAIKARLARYDADPSTSVPWEDVEARVEKQLKELGE